MAMLNTHFFELGPTNTMQGKNTVRFYVCLFNENQIIQLMLKIS